MKVTFPKVLFFLVLLLSSNVKFAFVANRASTGESDEEGGKGGGIVASATAPSVGMRSLAAQKFSARFCLWFVSSCCEGIVNGSFFRHSRLHHITVVGCLVETRLHL